MPLAYVVVGFALLFAGRRLFWLFVAAVGFVAGLELVTPVTQTEPTAAALLVAFLAGAIGAGLALFLQPLAIAVAGFAAGAMLLESLGVPDAGEGLLVLLVGGLVSAVVMVAVFDWALIALSSLFGAHIVVAAVPLAPRLRAVAFAVLLVVGLLVQARVALPGSNGPIQPYRPAV